MTGRPVRLVATLVAGLVVVLFAAVIWPTPYRDFPLRGGSRTILAARQHRLTGRVELLTETGWHPLDRPLETPPEDPLVARMRALDSSAHP